MDKVTLLRRTRDDALRRGDFGVYRSCCADLARVGIDDGPPQPPALERVVTASGMETTAVKAPEKRGGRPKLPRCEHDRIAARCVECNEG